MKKWIVPVIGLMILRACKNEPTPASVSVLEMHRATLTEDGFCARQQGPGLSDAGTPLPLELIFRESDDEAQVLVHDQSVGIRPQQAGQGKVIRQ